MKRLSVAVVVPTYNSGNMINDAVQSVLGQTIPVDLIVVDDGSTDDITLQALDALRQRGITVLRHVTNKGQPAALNTGVAKANADVILRLDSDDYIADDFCRKSLMLFDKDESLGIVSSDIQWVGARSGCKSTHDLPNGVRSLLFANHVPSASFFRRSDWGKVGGLDEDLRWGEDWDFWLRILAIGRKSIVIHEPLTYRRVHDRQITRTTSVADKESVQFDIMLKNRSLYSESIEDVLTELYIARSVLRSFKRRYGWLNNVINASLDVVRSRALLYRKVLRKS